MSKTLRPFTVAVAILVVAGALLADFRPAPLVAEGGIRFVDMQRCLDNFPAVQAEMEALRNEFGKKAEEVKVREAKIDSMQGELAIMDPNSDEYLMKRYEAEAAIKDLERDDQFWRSLLEKKRLELFLRSYSLIQEAAAQYAQSQGFSAILVRPGPMEELPKDLQSAVQSLQMRPVLWANPAYDVTEQVIPLLQKP
ncbi:MAG: OmpH family outer membrane protein [Planctomycetota bacterium]|nr:MAG: OmpH family outer membrane protein [Planctomycetota bacterium]